MTTTDARGNLHAGKGTSTGGQFESRQNARPPGLGGTSATPASRLERELAEIRAAFAAAFAEGRPAPEMVARDQRVRSSHGLAVLALRPHPLNTTLLNLADQHYAHGARLRPADASDFTLAPDGLVVERHRRHRLHGEWVTATSFWLKTSGSWFASDPEGWRRDGEPMSSHDLALLPGTTTVRGLRPEGATL